MKVDSGPPLEEGHAVSDEGRTTRRGEMWRCPNQQGTRPSRGPEGHLCLWGAAGPDRGGIPTHPCHRRCPTEHPGALVRVAMTTPPSEARMEAVFGGEFAIPTQVNMTAHKTVGEPPPLLGTSADAQALPLLCLV